VLLFALTACDPLMPWPADTSSGGIPDPRVAASPASLDFGEVSVSGIGSITLDLSLTNLGDQDVTVSGHDQPIGDDGFVVGAEPLLTLLPGETRLVPVTFAPTTEQADQALIRIEPGGHVIDLRGIGHAPVAVLGEADVDPVVLGCTGVGQLPIRNDGTEPLHLLDAAIAGDDFALTGWPDEVAPGQEGLLEFSFTPTGSDARGGVLTLSTDDPLQPAIATTISALGYEGERVTEAFRYAPTRPTDILFAVQGDLGNNDDRLAPALSAYVGSIRADNVDYQVTALSSADRCPPDTPAWVDRGSTELATINVLDRAFHAAGGAWDRDLVGLVLAALDATQSGECLDGFRRDGAALDIVVVGTAAPSVDVAAVFEALTREQQGAESVRLSALVPLGGDCGEDGNAYESVALSSGGAAGDYCDGDWAPAFLDFADFPNVDGSVAFTLAATPVESTIEVTVDGAAWPDWTWDAASNSVIVGATDPPALGAEVTVTYVSAVSCAEVE
jgi:hypothetical protein